MSDDAQTINDVNNPTERREKMWEQSARLLGLMNGGSAVALLAFVQAIWKDMAELVVWVVYGLIVFAVGLALATIIPQLRESTVLNWRSNGPKAKVYQCLYRSAAKLSVLSFLVGVGFVAYGILASLPKPSP
jgi:hypothetical protein